MSNIEEIADQLKKLIVINNKINNQLDESDEADITFLEEKFDRREEYVKKLTLLIPEVDTSGLTKEQNESFKILFSQFDQQSQNIQKVLEHIVEKSKDQLDDAIKRRKAEEKYQLLK